MSKSGAADVEKAAPKEETPLSDNMQALKDAYGTGSHITFTEAPLSGKMYATDYEVAKLSSFRVCCAYRGTILEDPVLFIEQGLLTLLFFSMAIPTYYFFKTQIDDEDVGHIFDMRKDMSVRRYVDQQEPKMRAFSMIMTGLAAFLLSFYTAIAVGRWWTMRTGGVGGIKAATVDLELLLYQNVTQEEEVLSAVRRYGRTSLMLIFLWRSQRLPKMKEILTSMALLTEHECDCLLKWNHVLHETIWAWQSAIVTTLYLEGKIKSDQLFQQLLTKCTDGRSAAQLVHTHLAVRAPMQYIHLLGLLVKMHNAILAIIMGILFGAAWGNSQVIIMVQTFGRTLILPFLFNAILLINAQLSDPFNGSASDFPGSIYQGALEKDCQGMIGASKNFPEWLEKRSGSAV